MIPSIYSEPWAIIPERLSELKVFAADQKPPLIPEGLVLTKGDPEEADPGYEVRDGVAVIAIEGVLRKKSSRWWWDDSTSMNDVKDAFRYALDDPSVHSIVLYIDSPGGTVDGTQELASVIKAARGRKPIVAYSDGLMASAAYWIGSAADKIYISGDTVEVGSIGIVAAHIDVSKMEEDWGVKVTEITAGQYKRIASVHAPLSEDGRSYIQDQVDHLYAVFVDTVAGNRGKSTEEALAMADGKIFIGRQAVQMGLVDGIATMDQIISELKEEHMTQEELKSKFPAVYQAILDEGKALGYSDGLAQGKAEGAEAERERIKSVEAQALPGHEALIAAMKYDGKTTGAEAAVAILAAEKSKHQAALNAMISDAPAVIAPDNPPVVSGPESGKEDPRPLEEKAKEAWEKSPDLRAEFKGNFNAYLAYEQNAAAGRIRIYGRK